MARCLRCHAGNEWIEGDVKPEPKTCERELAAAQRELAEAKQALNGWRNAADKCSGRLHEAEKALDFYKREASKLEQAEQDLAAYQAAELNWNCEQDGCAKPERVTLRALEYSEKFHEYKNRMEQAEQRAKSMRWGHDDSRVLFYEREFYPLSNFSAFRLEWDGLMFDTSEAAYHYEKFPDHIGLRDAIRHAPSAHEALKIAEGAKDYRRRDWDEVKVGVMRNIIKAKSEQHEYVRRKLLETGTRELIEDSWRDDFWGSGKNGDGRNMLGKLWMEIRAALAPASAETAPKAESIKDVKCP